MDFEEKEYTLEEVCHIIRGQGKKDDKETDTLPMCLEQIINDGKIQNKTISYCRKMDLSNDKTHIKKGDIVIATTRGEAAINLTDTVFVLPHYMLKLEPKLDVLDKRFLYYFLIENKRELEKAKVDSNVSTIRLYSIEKMKIKIPPLIIQRIIVAKLNPFLELSQYQADIVEKRNEQFKYYLNFFMSDAMNKSKIRGTKQKFIRSYFF